MRLSLSQRRVLTLGAVASAAALICAPGHADESPKQLERVVVVGSNLKRIDAEGPSPIQVYKRADIEGTGATTLVEALFSMSSTTSGFDGSEGNSFAPGAAAVSLRGMGEKNVLVLLNGRRLANYGFAAGTDSTFVDLNSLPLSAIDEIQVLRDGASAIYGSDAVAGVINFVTRRDFQGLELGTKYSQNTAGDLKTGSANLTAGFGEPGRDRFNLLATLDLYQRGAKYAGKHKYTRSNDQRAIGGQDGRSISLNPGSYYKLATGERLAMPGCSGTSVVEVDERGDEYCRTDVDPSTKLSPDQKRATGILVGTYELSKDTQLFGELSLNRNRSNWTDRYQDIEYYQSDRYIMPEWGSYKPELGEGAPLMVFRSIYEAGRSTSRTVSDNSRLLAGARGTFGSYDWEAAASHSRNSLTLMQDGVLKRSAVTEALKSGSYDPFALKNPETAWRPLLTSVERQASSKLSTLDAKISNPEAFRLGGPVGVAAGLQFMRESMKDTPDAQVQARNIENMGGTGSDGSRRVSSAFVELSLQPVKKLEVQLALRGDHYSDFGNTVNPKTAMAWRPSDSVLIRAGYNTAFKAPTLPQMHMAETTAYSPGVADWIRCVPLGLGPDLCRYNPKMLLVSNDQLKPEKTRIASFGAVFNPTRELLLSLDYYRLEQRDAIQVLDGQFLLDHEFDTPGYDKLVIRDPRNPALEERYPGLKHGRLNTIITPFINVGRVTTDGVDIEGRYTFNLAGGKFSLRNELNYQFHFKQSDVEDQDPTERLDSYYRPKWRNVLSLAYERGAWAGSLRANTNASVLNIDDPTHVQEGQAVDRLPSYTTLDFNIRYKGFKHMIVNAGISNFTDKRPRFATQYGTYLDSTDGPNAYVSLRYAFH